MAVMILTIMGVGAVFAAVNVMHSALAARTREIGMLLAVGFSRRGMLARLIAESLTMAVAGGLLGCAVTALLVAVGGGHRDLVGTTTFTSVAFSVRIGAAHVGYSLLAALAVGFLGGFWPAHCATRISVVASLRAA
jgi:putative ABC transport system permease protein